MRTPLLATVLLIFAAAAPAAQEMRFFTVAAGPIGGGYHTAATAICTVVHREHPGLLRCSPDPTPGSVYNVQALKRGDVDFAIVQSDTHRQAVEGTESFADAGPDAALRSVLSLFPEPLTLLARTDAGVSAVGDLAGKRINIGPRNSGTRATVERLLDELGLAPRDFAEQSSLDAPAALDELCEGRLDAALIVIGHPNAAIGRALATCDVDLVGVASPALAVLLQENADYSAATIRAGTYPDRTRDVPTFSVTATLMTRDDMAPDLVTALAAAVVDNLPDLNRSAGVIPPRPSPGLAGDGLTAPLHEGAAPVLDPLR